MSVLFTDIIGDAMSLADFDGSGSGSTLGLDVTRWSIWGNQSIESLYKKFLIWNPDLFESTAPDYTLSLEEGVITPPTDYRSFRGLTKSPGTFAARTVHKFNYGARDDQCDVHYREAGKAIRLEPKYRSNGTYRLTYTAGPVNLSTGDAPASQQVTDATVKAMGGGEIGLAYLNNSAAVNLVLSITDHSVRLAGGLSGTWNPAGIGPGGTLTAAANGAFQIDGTTANLNDEVLIVQTSFTNYTPNNYGWYRVTQAGDGSHPGILTRSTSYDEPGEVTFGSSFYVTAGATNVGKRFVMDTPGTIVVGATQLSFDVAGTPQLLVDGVNVGAGDKVFVLTGAPAFDGIWDVAITVFTKGLQWTLTRSAGQVAGTTHPVGYTIAVQQGAINGNRIWQANGNVTWAIQSSAWSKLQAAVDAIFEPAREWLGVRTAMRALGKEESNTGELGARLAELTAELQVYVQSLDSGDGDCAVDVEGDHRPGIYRLLGH